MFKRIVHLWRSDKRKEKGFRLLECHAEKGNLHGETKEDRGIFSKNCYVDVPHTFSGLIGV